MAPVSTLLPHRVYSRQALLALGIAERRFSDGSLIRVLPGCYTRADCPAPLQEIARVLQRAIAPQTVISHLTAATLFGLPLPAQVETRAREGPLHGRVPPGTDRRRSAQLDLHRMKPGPTVLHGGLSLSHPVEVCREISSLLDDTDLVVCLDALAGRWGTTESLPLESIRRQADLLSGRGSARVRRAAAQAVENVWSPMETRLRLLLVASGFPAGTANMQLIDPDTHQVFYLDIAYPRWRIAIEFDGDRHRTDRAQWQRDLHKNHVLHAAGWTVLRISSADLRDPQRFLYAASRRRSRGRRGRGAAEDLSPAASDRIPHKPPRE